MTETETETWHSPALVAAVQVEALRRYGRVVDVMTADAALLWVTQRPGVEPAHHAATAALEVWRVEHGVWP